MKTFVLFTFAIYGIGGTQIYARNKMLYMQKKGWNTCMVTTEPGDEILVKEMEPFKAGVFPELMRNPYLYSPWKRKHIIKRVIGYIFKFTNSSDEIVIESNFMAITPWAELIAEKLKIKNLIFLIQEDYNIKSKKYLDFFYFKYKRGELAVNTPQALSILFKDYPNFDKSDNSYLSAYCSNVVEDCKSVLGDSLEEADYNIGSVGRINKPFVLPMVEQLVRYVLSKPERTFNLVFFGGSPVKEDIDNIRKATEGISNIKVLVTGPIFPVPLCDLKKMDVCVSSAGAALTSTDAGILTIAVDAIDYEPIGIVKCTTNNIIHRGKSAKANMSDLLDQILIEKKYEGILYPQIMDYSAFFDLHVNWLSKSEKKLDYYKVKKLAPKLLSQLAYFIRLF